MYAHFMKLDTYLYIYKYTVSIMMCIYISLSNIWLSTISRFSPLQVSMLAGYERQAFQSGPFWFQGSVPASVETVGVGWMWQKTGCVVDIGGSVFVEVETIPSKTTIITNKRRLILQFILFFCVSVGCWYSSLQNCEGDHSVILQRVLACSSAVVCHWNRLLIRLRCRFMMSCIRSIDVWFYLFQRTWLFMNVWMYDSYDVLVFYSSISISQWVSSRTRKWNTSTKRRN